MTFRRDVPVASSGKRCFPAGDPLAARIGGTGNRLGRVKMAGPQEAFRPYLIHPNYQGMCPLIGSFHPHRRYYRSNRYRFLLFPARTGEFA